MTDPIPSLVERLEKAKEPTSDLMLEAYEAIRGERGQDAGAHGWQFGKMLDVGAYEQAALMLVPEGKEWRVEQRYGKGMRPAYCSIWSFGARDTDFHASGDARAVALAIVIAALRALHQGEDNG